MTAGVKFLRVGDGHQGRPGVLLSQHVWLGSMPTSTACPPSSHPAQPPNPRPPPAAHLLPLLLDFHKPGLHLKRLPVRLDARRLPRRQLARHLQRVACRAGSRGRA